MEAELNNKPKPNSLKVIAGERNEHTPHTTIDDQLENILSWAQNKFGDNEFIEAKEDFFLNSGKVFYDDTFYEQRMGYFLDYFLLERPLTRQGTETPFSEYMAQPQAHLWTSKEDSLHKFCHSLFLVLRSQSNSLIVLDLINDQKIKIMARKNESFTAIQRKDLLQGYLYQSQDHYYLSHGLLFHPSKLSRFIKKEIKKAKNCSEFDQLKFLLDLAKQNLKYLRHIHVDPKRIYNELFSA